MQQEEEYRVDIQAELEECHDLFKKFTQHYLIDKHPKNPVYLAFKIGFLSIAAASSAWLYLNPSIEYGYRFHSKTLGILQGVGNLLAAFFVTLNVSQMYINSLESQHEIKRDLGELIEKTNRLKSIVENTLIIGGAGVSAAVFTAPSLQYSTELALWLRIFQAILITFDYSLIHTLPMEILVNTRLRYVAGFPFYAMYYSYELLRRKLLTPEESYRENLAAQTQQDHQRLKLAMTGTLEMARKKIFEAFFPRNFDFPAGILGYQLNYNHFKPILDKTDGMEKYIALLEYGRSLPDRKIRKFPSWFENYINPAASGFFWFTGAAFETLSIAGFLLSTYNEGLKFTGSRNWALMIAAPPTIVTIVLVCYFGGLTFQGLYDSLVAAVRGDYETPLPVKLFSKMVLGLMFLSALISYYSSGPATELVYRNYPGDKCDEYCNALAWTAFLGVILYCFINMFEIVFSGVRSFAKSVGGEESEVVVLDEQIASMKGGIMQLDGNKLESSLSQLSSEKRGLILGMTDKEYKAIIDHQGQLSGKYKGLMFFSESEEKQHIVAVNSQEPDYGSGTNLGFYFRQENR